jgi:hypothetical protein
MHGIVICLHQFYKLVPMFFFGGIPEKVLLLADGRKRDLPFFGSVSFRVLRG